jgi:hypothetical protein
MHNLLPTHFKVTGFSYTRKKKQDSLTRDFLFLMLNATLTCVHPAVDTMFAIICSNFASHIAY